MSYRLINANELNTVITPEDYDKVLKMPCIYADLPNGLDNNHYSLHKWIPVSERLPDEETDVLVCCETGAITVCCGSYSTEVSDTFIWYTEGWRLGKVVAWMPLPQPYKAESEG